MLLDVQVSPPMYAFHQTAASVFSPLTICPSLPLMPLYCCCWLPGISEVIPLCTFVVFMGALSSVAYALWEEHPQEQGETLVDYEAIAIIAPALLLGTVYGEWEAPTAVPP